MFASRTGPATGPGIPVPLDTSDEGGFVLTASQAREWESLRSESDLRLLADEILRFARKLEGQGKNQAAASVYQRLLDDPRRLPQRKEAERRLQALSGAGPWGLRFENQLHHWLQQAADPSVVVGMTAAGFAFQGLRCATLARLLGSVESNLFTRGTGAYLVANAAGFAAELPTLVFADRGMHELMGRGEPEVSWSEDLARAGLQMFFLKGAGALSAGLSTAPSIRQAGALAGIVLARSMEIGLGWQPARDPSEVLFDSLLVLGQFQIGAAWSRGLWGPGTETLWRGLERRTQSFRPGASDFSFLIERPVPVSGGGFGSRDSEMPSSDSVLMNSRLKEHKFESNSETRRLRERLSASLGKTVDSQPVEELTEEIRKIPDPVKTAYADLLPDTVPQIRQGSAVADRMLLGATSCFAYLEELDPLRRASGSFYDSLVQEFFERSLAERNGKALGSLIRTLSGPGDVTTLEKLFRSQGWQARYGLEVFMAASPETMPENWERVVQGLPKHGLTGTKFELGPRMIGDYFRAYHAGTVPEEWRNPAHNYLWAARGEESPTRHSMDLPVLARGLHHMVQLLQEDAGWGDIFYKISEIAHKSPVPVLYFDRLFKLLATEGPTAKLGDLAFPQPFNLTELRLNLADAAGPKKSKRAGARINGKFETGFVDDLPFARKLARLYEELPALLDEATAPRRAAAFLERAGELLRERARANRELGIAQLGHHFLPVDLMDLLEIQPTATSKQAREAFLRGEVDLHLLPYHEMQALWSRQVQSSVSRLPALSLFLPASLSGTGRPLVAVTETSPSAPFEEKVRRSFLQASSAVHEFEHFSHHGELPFQNPLGLLRAEMRAALEQLHFQLKNGDLSEWEKIRPLAAQGLGIYLRSRIEQDYMGEPRLISIKGR